MRGSTSKCRQAKRCILFFLAIALLPLLVIYFLISDQMRHVHHMNVSIHKYIGNICAYVNPGNSHANKRLAW